MRAWPQTVISQYSSSPHLTALLGYVDDWLSPDARLEAFYNLVMNLDTAQGYGLDVWGRIVGVVRILTVDAGEFFGFTGLALGTTSGDSWTAAPFYEGSPVTSNYVLTDDAFRQLIFAKAASNITNGSIEAINAILMNILFPNRGNVYIQDNLDMTFVYVFTFTPTPVELAIVTSSGVMPRPVGTSFTVSYPS